MRVYTGGTFDLFHSGHINFLKACSALTGYSGEVVVALNTDEFIFEYKGRKPINSFEERLAVLSACRYVDRVVTNVGGKDSKPTILKVKPDILVVGSDWATKNYYDQMCFDQSWLDSNKIILAYVPYTKGISSTLIRESLGQL